MKHVLIFLALLCVMAAASAQTPEPASPADLLWKDACAALESKQYQDAQRKFEEFTRRFLSDPRAAEARIRIGICDYRQGGRTARALDAWNRVVNMELMRKLASPALLLGLEQLAGHYRSQQDMRELEKILAHLAGVFPDAPATHLEHVNTARLRMEAGEYAAASVLYGKVSTQLQGNDLLNYELSKELSSPKSSVSAILTSANAHLADDSVPLAARLYEEALKRNPVARERAEAMTKLGWCLYLQHKHKEAEKLWQQVIKQGRPGDEWVGQSRWHMIQLLTGPLNRTDKAVELCDVQAVEFSGSFRGQQGMFVKAWIYWLSKDWLKAHRAFMDLISAYPEVMQHEPIRNYIRDCEQGIHADGGRK